MEQVVGMLLGFDGRGQREAGGGNRPLLAAGVQVEHYGAMVAGLPAAWVLVLVPQAHH